MKLELSNFKCHEFKQFEFTENNVILISGKSGVGKTSIIEAIVFVLFGSGRKITKYGQKSCYVRLQINIHSKSLDIKRTKGPNRLTLEYLDTTFMNNTNHYEDAAAQGVINELFGTQYESVGYLSQSSLNSFVLMGPQEKLSFLENLVFKSSDLKETKQKVQNLIKERTQILQNTTGKVEMLSDIISTTSCENETFPVLKKSGTIITDKREQEIVEKNTDTEIRNLTKKIDVIDKKLTKLSTMKTNQEQHEKAIEKYNNEYNSIKKMFTKTVDELIDIKDVGTPSNSENFEENINQYIDLLNILIDKNTDEYKKNNLVLDEIKNNDKYFELQKSITEKTKQYDDLYNSELSDLQHKKDQYSKKIISDDVIEEHTTEIDDLNEYIQTIEKYKTLTNEKSSIVKSLQKIISKHTTSLNLSDHPISDNSIQYIDTILTTVDDKITNLSETIEKLVVDINKIKLMGKRYKCPECSVGLSFCSKTNELILFHKDSEHNEDLEDVLVKKRKSLSKYTELSETIKKHKTQLINIEKNIQKIVDTYELEDLNITDSEIDDIRVSIKELQEKIYTNKETIISCKNIDEKLCDKTLMNHMLKQISKEISTLSKEFDSLQKPKIHNVDKSELLEKTTKLKFEINRYNTLSKDLERISDELYSIEKVTSSPEKLTMKSISKHIELNNNEREKNVMQKSNMIQQQHDIATWKVKHEQYCIYEMRKTELNELENTIKEIKDKLQSIYKLKDYIKKAENILLERAINQINNYVANYLDIFFQTDPINVNLCTRYDEKSSSKNGQLTLTIDYKGMDADLSILSGGELQRVVIAYNLALSELFSVPMILLDECTSNLDQELTEIVVKGIKRNCGEKTMIMIAHQVVSGIFDTTVEIQ